MKMRSIYLIASAILFVGCHDNRKEPTAIWKKSPNFSQLE